MEKDASAGQRVNKVPIVLILAVGERLMELHFAKTLYSCPHCESVAIRRSTRRGVVERVFLRLALVWPYRCDDCDSRFWGFQRNPPSANPGRLRVA
jgi:hypothetical protein